MALYWASANRDEEVFEDPFEFRIDRPPGQPVVFGFGPHLCMGAHVARVELQAMFSLLVARMDCLLCRKSSPFTPGRPQVRVPLAPLTN